MNDKWQESNYSYSSVHLSLSDNKSHRSSENYETGEDIKYNFLHQKLRKLRLKDISWLPWGHPLLMEELRPKFPNAQPVVSSVLLFLPPCPSPPATSWSFLWITILTFQARPVYFILKVIHGIHLTLSTRKTKTKQKTHHWYLIPSE